jgi:hypothetical protein
LPENDHAADSVRKFPTLTARIEQDWQFLRQKKTWYWPLTEIRSNYRATFVAEVWRLCQSALRSLPFLQKPDDVPPTVNVQQPVAQLRDRARAKQYFPE